ncbi:retrotransposon protein, putative, ty1-copia subclass [Tanacetum coccineum]
MTTLSANNSVFRGFFKKQKLTGPNFIDWYRQLRIVLSIKDKLNYLEQPLPPAHVALKGQQIQQNLENLHANDMLKELKTLFAQQAEHELLQTVRDFHSCKQEEGQSVRSYILKMKSYIDNLERLGHPVSLNLGVSLILILLRKEFDSFVQNYNMHNMGKTINGLHAMLKLYKKTLPKHNAPSLHAIRAGKVQKGNNKHKKPQPQLAAWGQNQRKGKNKLAYAPKPKIPPPPKREDPAKDSICHQCGDTGHWKRNYPQYLAELLKIKKLSQGASGLGIFTIKLYTFPNKSWVYDTGCGTHIYNTTQGLSGSRKLKPCALSLYVGNGQRREVEAIGSYHLSLPSGLVIVLNNYHYAPFITRGIILVSSLYDDGCVNCFVDNSIQVSKNNMVYFSVVLRDGIFEIDLSDSYTNVSSIYALSNKRSKSNLDSALLWHCHLRHISKKHIEKLQHDGLLNSTDLMAFEKCVPCMSGKMARKPYIHQVERAKDLLGLIHIDVCGPFKIMSRQGARYFITFTVDFSRYGYVYLLKHKHEVFETIKVFQKEVENQLENSLITQEESRSLEDLEIIQEEDTHPSIDTSLNHEEDGLEIDEPQSNIIPIHRSTRTRHAPDRMFLYIDAKEHELGDLDNEVWDLVDLPPNGKTVGSKWLFKKKTNMDGAVHTYKARLMAKGYTQTPRIDYEETFSPVADIRSIRILIAIAAFYDYEIWKMDVKTSFLNGYLYEEVYMEQPKGFVNPKYPNRVCKLKRSIYGLKQASRQWNKCFDNEKKKFGFTQNRDEPCEYLKASGSNVTFLILYVDDILIMGNNIPMLQDVKSYLGRCFAMKDLGEAAYILGIKIYRDRSQRLIGLCQSVYIEKILKRYHMENSKRGSIPMQEKLRLSKSQGASTPTELKCMQNVPYALAVGSIMYDVRCTRPDVANSKDMFLVYEGDIKRELRGACYTDVGYLTDADDLKSQTGYLFILNGGVEAIWVRKFISGLGVIPTIKEPINMHCDNTIAITIANESRITKGARHYRTKVHYLREVIEFSDIKLEKVYTDDNLADPFTKALAFPKHSEHTKNIGMLPSSSLM